MHDFDEEKRTKGKLCGRHRISCYYADYKVQNSICMPSIFSKKIKSEANFLTPKCSVVLMHEVRWLTLFFSRPAEVITELDDA